ncbi:MAG: acyclic terpene utilization AtuA family protein [Betaproteobacteria bacterium]
MKQLACVVGAGAGFAGDRVDPAVTLARSGVDAVVLECLAERTLVPAIRSRRENPQAGFDPRLVRRLTPLLPVARQHGCRIVSNLGAANPVAAAQRIAQLARDLGLPGLKVAAIVGDDVSDRAAQIRWSVEPGAPLLGAHAYLGCHRLADALAQGADVVVAGRVADSALFSAVARDRLEAGPQALAGAIGVGHLLECGGQLSGGNYEPIAGAGRPPPLSPQEYACLGYPLAQVMTDGSAEIALPPGTPGILDPLTCTLQLLYEVHDPSFYATPDLVVDFSGVRFDTLGPNRVRMSGVASKGPPPMLKVAGFVDRPGFIMDCEIALAGDGAFERAQVMAEALRLRLPDWAEDDIAIDLVGASSVLRAGSMPILKAAPELRVHVSARCRNAEQAQTIEDEVYAMTLSGPAGGSSVRSERRPRVEVLDGFIAHEQVSTEIVWSRS